MHAERQPTFPGFAPEESRKEPAVWVRALAVHGDWPPARSNLLRRVTLRRGLNILWARPDGATSEASRLGGHGAGKTLFCRLLRYVLDEAHPGTEAFRNAFNTRYRNGWVLAEVLLGGKPWLIARPLGRTGRHPFAVPDGRLDGEWPATAPLGGYREYQEALDAAVFEKLPMRQLAGSGRRLDWACLLPWLSRDQEAHYGALLEWRHKDSQSGSPDLLHTDKENLVRVLLGVIHPDEQGLLRDHAKTSQSHTEALREQPKLEYVVARARTRLQTLLGHPVTVDDELLVQQDVAETVKILREEADASLAAAREDVEMDRLNQRVSEAETAWSITQLFADELAGNVGFEEGRAEATLQQANDNQNLLSLRELVPFEGFCSHVLGDAWRARCPLADKREDDDVIEAALLAPITEAQAMLHNLAQEQRRLARQRELAAQKLRELTLARKNRDDLRTSRDTLLQSLTKPRERAEALETAFRDYRDVRIELESLRTQTEEVSKQKDRLDREIAKFIKRHEGTVLEFGQVFDGFVQAMLGTAVEGRVVFSGKGLEPKLLYHGPRDSAALKVTKLLAFDLAALHWGVTRRASHHPRFLIHDSPREADLAAGIYRALFAAVRELEEQFTEGEAPFQYIVTTTEPPPENLNGSPWRIEPVLDASQSGERFLGVDL